MIMISSQEMDLWNVKDLQPPPVSSCKITTKEIDIRLLDAVLKDGINFFENQQHLCTEAALLSRTVYRLKMKFRSSKDFKAVEKLSRVLRTYLEMQISKLLETLLHSIPENYTVNETYMLTKNMMDYVLVRIQGLGKTLYRILETCKVSSAYLQQKLRIGHFWKIVVVIFATTARIFVIAKSILKYACELYTNLLPFSSSLTNSGVQWLPERHVFPNRLDEWLNIDWLDLENNVIEIPDDDDQNIMSYFRLPDSDDDVEFCDEYIIVNDEASFCEEVKFPIQSVDLCESTTLFDNNVNILNCENLIDVGEVINVSDVESPKRLIRKRQRSPLKQRINVKKKVEKAVLSDIESPNLLKRKRKRTTVTQPINVKKQVKKMALSNYSHATKHSKRKRKGLEQNTYIGQSSTNNASKKPKTGKKRSKKKFTKKPV